MSTLLGTLYGNVSGMPGTDNFCIDVRLVSQDAVNLTSDLEFQWFVLRPSGWTTHINDCPWEQTTQAGTQTGTEDFDIRDTAVGSWYYIMSTYATVPHTPDGKRTLALYATFDLRPTTAGIAELTEHYLALPDIPVQAEAYFKANNTWEKGKVWYKTGGTWVKAKKIYTKVNGSWQQGQ